MSKKNFAEELPIDGASLLPETDTVEQVLGFPAYWEPSDEPNANGNHGVIYATVTGFDDSDPDFERWIFTAKHTTRCFKGPVGDQKEIIVQPGQFFSVANKVQLRLKPYIGLDVQLTAKDKVKIDGGKTMWNFRLDVTKETAKLLTERRVAMTKAVTSGSAAAE
jgi:hypothetical protein